MKCLYVLLLSICIAAGEECLDSAARILGTIFEDGGRNGASSSDPVILSSANSMKFIDGLASAAAATAASAAADDTGDDFLQRIEWVDPCASSASNDRNGLSQQQNRELILNLPCDYTDLPMALLTRFSIHNVAIQRPEPCSASLRRRMKEEAGSEHNSGGGRRSRLLLHSTANVPITGTQAAQRRADRDDGGEAAPSRPPLEDGGGAFSSSLLLDGDRGGSGAGDRITAQAVAAATAAAAAAAESASSAPAIVEGVSLSTIPRRQLLDTVGSEVVAGAAGCAFLVVGGGLAAWQVKHLSKLDEERRDRETAPSTAVTEDLRNVDLYHFDSTRQTPQEADAEALRDHFSVAV